jgi:hypothetical protein
LSLWGRLHDKSKPVHKALRRDALQGALFGMDVGDPHRLALQTELKDLSEFLASIPVQALDILAEDDDR